MPSLYSIVYFLLHPRELRSVVQWKLWHEPVYRRDPARACETENKCFDFLNQTSRSFSAVILELHPELLMPICLFYLILRGLDTVEDDTSIPLKTKEPVLRNFHEHLEQDGWTFDGNRPEEKDRQLLVQFNNVVTEFKKIKPVYKEIIKDIAKRMGDGMADYCKRAELGDDKVETVKEYDLYCYYVAGLVGEGLTRLFVEAGFGHRALLERPNLFISMGLFLQKTNIIRDIKEDEDDERRFWPKAIWAKHVDNWEDLFNPEKRDAALNCSSEMILNALGHVEECLIYLSGLTEQSVFNFATIPQAMAIATLELCFRNYEMFGRNVKITKGDACQLMWQSTQNVQVTCNTFREYIRRVHRKNTPRDPNFLDISACCGKIESFIESLFPSQSPPQKNLKTRIIATEKPGETIEVPIEEEESNSETLFVAGTMLSFALGISLLVLFVAYLMGARLDIAFNQMKAGNFKPLIHQDL